MEKFNLISEYIELYCLLKVAGPMISGGEAKQVIAEGLVTVDGTVETRKKCKIRANQTVQFEDYMIRVEAGFK